MYMKLRGSKKVGILVFRRNVALNLKGTLELKIIR